MKTTIISLLSGLFLVVTLSGQVRGPEPINVPPIDECNCDIQVIAINPQPAPGPPDPPIPGPGPGPGGPIRAVGNLDEFVIEKDNGECATTVEIVQKRTIVNIFNSIQELLDRFDENERICFYGDFKFKNTITIGHNQVIRLVDETTFIHNGDGTSPGIEFDSDSSTLDGGGSGTIISNQANSEGLITINTQGNGGNETTLPLGGINSRGTNWNQIKDITLVSQHESSGSGEPSSNRAIVMHNTPEGLIWVNDDVGASFWNIISGVTFKGFSTGIHLRGWSNANLFSDLTMESITDYGIWLTGTVDNSFSNINFIDSPNASAIRLDNYTVSREELTELNGTPLPHINDLSAPRARPTFLSQLQYFHDNFTQAEFFNLLHEAGDRTSEDLALIYQYKAIGEFCRMRSEVTKTVGGDVVLRYGLLDLGTDYLNMENISGADLDISDFDGTDMENFGIPNLLETITDRDNIELPPICTNTDRELLSNYYIPPYFNSFSDINVFANNVQQVKHIVSAHDTETDAYFQWRENLPCHNNYGNNNKIILCIPEGSTFNGDMMNNQTQNGSGGICPWQEDGIKVIVR